MRILSSIILTIICFSLNAQTDKQEFKNQGEQEDYWAKQFFDRNYSPTKFDKYKGDITTSDNSFRYSDQVLVVNNTSNNLKTIFSKGIFYPSIITGQTKSVIKTKEELDSLTTEQKVFYNLTRTDSLTISNFEELSFLKTRPTQRRFRFWLFRKGILNPTVCFIELTNSNATDKTDNDTFINEATLTFYKEGWIII